MFVFFADNDVPRHGATRLECVDCQRYPCTSDFPGAGFTMGA